MTLRVYLKLTSSDHLAHTWHVWPLPQHCCSSWYLETDTISPWTVFSRVLFCQYLCNCSRGHACSHGHYCVDALESKHPNAYPQKNLPFELTGGPQIMSGSYNRVGGLAIYALSELTNTHQPNPKPELALIQHLKSSCFTTNFSDRWREPVKFSIFAKLHYNRYNNMQLEPILRGVFFEHQIRGHIKRPVSGCGLTQFRQRPQPSTLLTE